MEPPQGERLYRHRDLARLFKQKERCKDTLETLENPDRSVGELLVITDIGTVIQKARLFCCIMFSIPTACIWSVRMCTICCWASLILKTNEHHMLNV